MFVGKRFGFGYECSSAGDKRFSAFYAKLEDGRTIEMHYQCDVKGYDPGGRNWKLGKGRPPLDKSKDMVAEYQKLWDRWAAQNQELIAELRVNAQKHGCALTDRFATTAVSQAKALANILNR